MGVTYYFKKGRLDLSLLDEKLEIQEDSIMDFEELFAETDLYIAEEDSMEETEEIDETLNVSQETYESLKELGKYFTNK
ncbi:MAG: hypothetical protein AB9856_10980 [Cellulosilyticaceae bacterium]